MASTPVSPVRMRMASSTLEMKILPSPMRPVRAAFRPVAALGEAPGAAAMETQMREEAGDQEEGRHPEHVD